MHSKEAPGYGWGLLFSIREVDALDDEDVTVSLARIETKLDRFMDDMKDHEKRLRGLERWQAQAIGVVAIVSAAITFGLQAVLGWIRGGAK